MDFHYLTIHEARDLLARKQISFRELTESFMKRIDCVEPTVQAFVTVTRELAIKQSKDAETALTNNTTPPLIGMPCQIKDVICTKGIPTTCSSKMLENFIPTYDATVVKKLYEQNIVILGKGNMDEFAMGSSTENSAFHITHNPWDIKRVPGGSSGGGAAAVSAGEAIFALGSDTGGSIRQPAAFCGTVGLKPTYGLVSRFGLIAFASSLDQIGPITRDVKDCALVLNAIAGYDSSDSTSINKNIPDYTNNLNGHIEGLRIGIPEEYFSDDIEPGVRNAVNNAIKVLETQGAAVEEISLPSTRYALSCYYIIAPSECSANLARYDGVKYGYSYDQTDEMWQAIEKTRQFGFGPEVKRRIMLGTYALSAGYYDAYYLKAQKVRTLIRQEFQDVFKRFDAIVAPTSPTVAFNVGARTDNPIQMYLSDILTIPANIAGIPAISIPCGMDNGLPVGLQIMGDHLNEETILRIAYSYEQASDWHLQRPPL